MEKRDMTVSINKTKEEHQELMQKAVRWMDLWCL